MASRDLYPQEILQIVLDKSCAKAQSSVSTLAVLSVLAGGYISFGYLAYLKVVSGIPHEWGGLATLLGAAMFPIALICILLGGCGGQTGVIAMSGQAKDVVRQRGGQVKIVAADGQRGAGEVGRLQDKGLGHDG